MMDRRRSRIAYLLPLVLLLAAGAVAQPFSAFEETNKLVRISAGRIEIYLMKGLVSERHLRRGKNGRLPDTSLMASFCVGPFAVIILAATFTSVSLVVVCSNGNRRRSR
jgi:hypothetical protein